MPSLRELLSEFSSWNAVVLTISSMDPNWMAVLLFSLSTRVSVSALMRYSGWFLKGTKLELSLRLRPTFLGVGALIFPTFTKPCSLGGDFKSRSRGLSVNSDFSFKDLLVATIKKIFVIYKCILVCRYFNVDCAVTFRLCLNILTTVFLITGAFGAGNHAMDSPLYHKPLRDSIPGAEGACD